LLLTNKYIVWVLSGALVVLVLLLFAPKVQDASLALNKAGESHDFSVHLNEFKSQLTEGQLQNMETLEIAIEKASGEDKLNLLDSLAKLWDDYKNPPASAIVFGRKTNLTDKQDVVRSVAEKFLFASKFSDDHLKNEFLEKAAEEFEKLLLKNPNDLTLKTDLAVCLVEGSQNPMKGIGLLKEVLEADPENIKAHVNLGYFSIKSGQYEKAIERFEKVINIAPDYPEAYIYLGDIYETLGNIEKAIENYSTYRDKVENPMLKREISNYILQLNQSIK
jgi:tetratricopeptide (TPR) repeat protein